MGDSPYQEGQIGNEELVALPSSIGFFWNEGVGPLFLEGQGSIFFYNNINTFDFFPKETKLRKNTTFKEEVLLEDIRSNIFNVELICKTFFEIFNVGVIKYMDPVIRSYTRF